MSGNGFRFKGVHQTAALVHIGRVGSDYIKGGAAENGARFFDIPFADGYPFFQFVHLHAAVCHFRAFRLNFQSGEMLTLGFCRQQDGDDACSCAQIQHLFSLFHLGKARKDDRIHAETEPLGVLNDMVTVPMEVIYPLMGMDGDISPHILSAPRGCVPVCVSFWNGSA